MSPPTPSSHLCSHYGARTTNRSIYLVPLLHRSHFLLQEFSHSHSHTVADIRDDVSVFLSEVSEFQRYLVLEDKGYSYQLVTALICPNLVNNPREPTDRWEVFQDLTIFLLALREAPLILVQEGVEVIEHGNLLVQRNGHVILHCVQCTQNQVENANCMSAS